VWLAIPGLAPRTSVAVPPATTVAPTGTLRGILRGGRVEVPYQVEDTAVTRTGPTPTTEPDPTGEPAPPTGRTCPR
jgi:hypothetical protein